MDVIKVKSEPVHYVDNKTFFDAIVERKSLLAESLLNNTPPPQLTNYLGDCLLRIADRLSSKGNFCNYSYKDEMVSDAIENCVVYFDKFDPERSANPFSYYTQIIYFAFLRRIKKEKDQFNIKHKIIQSVGATVLSLQEQDDDSNVEFINGYREYLKDFSNVFLPVKEKKIRKVKETSFIQTPLATLDVLYMD